MAVMHTTMIRASMTAYSTAVGTLPSFSNLTNALPLLRMVRTLSCWTKPEPAFLPDALPLCPGSSAGAVGCPCRSAAGALDLAADVVERVAGVGAQGRDGRDAHNDDQSQHDRVLNRRRDPPVLQQPHQRLAVVTHGPNPFMLDKTRARFPARRSSALPRLQCRGRRLSVSLSCRSP